jgi:HlyD family secretion protein
MSRKRPPIARLVLLVLAAGAGVAYGVQRYRRAHAPYEWSGTVETHTISLGSRAGGRVQQVLVKEGDEVTAGAALVVLEPGDWPAQMAQARAAVVQAEAQLAKLEKGARPEEIEAAKARADTARAALAETTTGARPEEIAAAQARLDAAEVAVEKAQNDAARMHKLDAAGAAVKADVDNADIAVRAAVASRDAVEAQLAQLKNGARREDVAQARARADEQSASARLVTAGTRTEDLAIARAVVDAAKGRVDQIQAMLDELTIVTPVAARIEALDLRPGDIIAPSSTAATVVEADQLFLRIYVPETQLGHVKVGQEVPIYVDSFDTAFKGVVKYIASVGEYSPRNLQTADERADQVFATRVDVVTGRDKLRAGMAAFISVPRE